MLTSKSVTFMLLANFVTLIAGQFNDDPFRYELEHSFLASRVNQDRDDGNIGDAGDDAGANLIERAHDLWIAAARANQLERNDGGSDGGADADDENVEGMPLATVSYIKADVDKSSNVGDLHDEEGWQAVSTVMMNYPKIGQIASICVNGTIDNNLVIFHRGSRVWDENAFSPKGVFLKATDGPIREHTILFYNPTTHGVIKRAAKNMFYMPHGLSLGRDGSLWVTDVAMHQVFHLVPVASEPYFLPELILGEAFQPGSDDRHFCQPTGVVEASDGSIFVADGYCNGRVMKFDGKTGNLLAKFGRISDASENDADPGTFLIPHSLALVESNDLICVADRENKRIQCFVAGLRNNSDTGRFAAEISHSEFGEIFAIKYAKKANVLLALSRDSHEETAPNKIFAIDAASGQAFESISVPGLFNGHDLAVDDKALMIYVSEIGPNRVWRLSRSTA